MRSIYDRVRHAISFEIIGLAIVTPLGALALNKPMADIGVLGLIAATAATIWNYIYNVGFDTALQRLAGSTRKSIVVRLLHAVLFEAGLLLALLPVISWYLDIGLVHAFVTDASFALFYVVYAFLFNWAYDFGFPDKDKAA